MKFHPDSEQLFLYGTLEEIDIVMKILDSVTEASLEKRSESQSHQKNQQDAQLRAQLEESKAQIDLLSSQVAKLKAEVQKYQGIIKSLDLLKQKVPATRALRGSSRDEATRTYRLLLEQLKVDPQSDEARALKLQLENAQAQDKDSSARHLQELRAYYQARRKLETDEARASVGEEASESGSEN